jgi:hypothetical protein
MLKLKKAISPVVATTLLLVVSVVSVVGFSSWFSVFSSSMLVDIESDSSSSNSVKIEDLVNGNLYVNSKTNSTINSISINDIDCNYNGSVLGLDKIDISSCIENISGMANVVIVTGNKIIESYTYLNNDQISLSSNLDCSGLTGGEWLSIPGNPTLGTEDFCVMKYEAKATTSSLSNLVNPTNMYCGNSTYRCPVDGKVNITSKFESRPLTTVYQNESRVLCSNLGEGYKLMVDPEWVTIGRIAESISLNWNSSIVGDGFMFSGHNDDPSGVSYNSSNDDSNGYYQTGDNVTNCDGNWNRFPSINDDLVGGRACLGQKRTLTLGDSQVIWDFGGNVWEWTNDTFDSNVESGLNIGTNSWNEWTSINSTYNYLKSINLSYNSSYGIGKIETKSSDAVGGGTIHGFIRGGARYNGAQSGVSSLSLDVSPYYQSSSIGFRCTYTQ